MGEKVIDIKWWELFSPIPGIQVGEGLSNQLVIEQECIPIVFVHGIMAGRLRNKNGDKVWDPDDALFMVDRYGKFNVTAKKRKALLVGASFDKDYLQVIEDDVEHNKKFADPEDPTRAERGWGGASWSSYGAFLNVLQARDDSGDVGALWDEPVRHCFQFPVHVFGYNWTASNRDGGKALAQYIDAVIQKYQGMGLMCEKVILITHSMGGLVARSACKLHGAEGKVLGVVHGVQPAMGAPAAYWRIKVASTGPATRPKTKAGCGVFCATPSRR